MDINQLINEFKSIDENIGVTYKNSFLKRDTLIHIIKNQRATISDIASIIKVSVPKANEIISELIDEGIINDLGKEVVGVGRKPNFYGLNPDACYFVSIEVHKEYVDIALINFVEKIIDLKENIAYKLENSIESFAALCNIIEQYLESIGSIYSIQGIGITLTGRINNNKGISYSFFNFHEKPVQEVFTERFGITTIIENDTRAMTFGEYAKGVVSNEKNIIFINIDEGIGIGIIINGVLYSGKSGYAGEFGHIPIFTNDIMCHCGKKGCLETEASGETMIKLVKEAIKQGTTSLLSRDFLDTDIINLDHLINAALKDDNLSIEIISNAAEKIGKGIATLLNLFNPELVIIGGKLAKLDGLLTLPILSSINKHSLHLINADTKFTTTGLHNKAGLIGMSLLTRNKIFAL